jgi:hypothetical protein
MMVGGSDRSLDPLFTTLFEKALDPHEKQETKTCVSDPLKIGAKELLLEPHP